MPRRTLRSATGVEEEEDRDVLVSIEKKIAELNQDAVFHQNHLDAIASKLRNLQRAQKYFTDK
jgi:hypothetical protein